MVIIPWFTDSVANAARCAQAGVARIVARDEITPDAVRAACADVLARPTYRRGAEAMRRKILALPPIGDLVTDIAAVVAS